MTSSVGPVDRDGVVLTTWDDAEWFAFPPTAVRIAGCSLGERTGADRTAFLITDFPAGDVIAAHSHDTDMIDVIVKGSLERDGRVHGVGTVRFVPRGVVYDAATAGPAGVTMLEFYAERRGVIGDPPDGADPTSVTANADVVGIFDAMLGPR